MQMHMGVQDHGGSCLEAGGCEEVARHDGSQVGGGLLVFLNWGDSSEPQNREHDLSDFFPQFSQWWFIANSVPDPRKSC